MSFRRVVLGIDFSERSLAAARRVAACLAPEAEIVLVHVLRRPDAPTFVQPFLEPMLQLAQRIHIELSELRRAPDAPLHRGDHQRARA